MLESRVILLNTILYIFLFLFCWKKYGIYNFSSIVSGIYAVSAIMGALMFWLPLYDYTFTSNGVATVEACLYQYTILSLLVLSLNNCRVDKCEKILNYNASIIYGFQKMVVCVLFIYLLFSLPNSIIRFFSGENLSDLRDEIYGVNSTDSNFIISLIGRIFGAMPILLLIIVSVKFCFFKKFTKLDKYSLIIYFLTNLNTIFAAVARATMMHCIIEVLFVIILFRSCLPSKIKRKLKLYLLVMGIPLYLLFTAITASRFISNETDFLLQQYSTIRYAGEAQINFMTLMYPDLKEPFYGFSQFPLYRRLLGLPYDDGLGREGTTVFNSYIQKYYNYDNPTYIFHGMAGTLYANWGWCGALLISFLIFLLHRRSYIIPKNLSFVQIIVSLLWATYLAKGVCYGVYQSESGNIMFLFIILGTFILKKNGKSVVVHNNLKNNPNKDE